MGIFGSEMTEDLINKAREDGDHETADRILLESQPGYWDGFIAIVEKVPYSEVLRALQKMVEAFDVGQEIKNPETSDCAIAVARRVLARVR